MNDQVNFGRDSRRPTENPQQDDLSTVGKKKNRAKASRNQFVVFFNFVFSLIMLAMIVVGGLLYYGKTEFEAPGPLKGGDIFTVVEGANLTQITSALYRNKMIDNQNIFMYGVRAMGKENALKAGEYEIAANASMKDIMETLVSGKAILHPLTVVEGSTVFQVMKQIEENEILTGEMPEAAPAEGMLIADTQRFSRGTSRSDIITRMENQQLKLVEQIWQKRQPDLPIKDMNEFVTLASIVEKETGVAEERPQVAAVFINRLRKGMRLQSDPTIIYGLFGGEGKPADRPIYQSDIKKETPYNTYVIDALPPGPIAIPGSASLEAVANPAQTEDLYFVADGTGGHVFAKTLDEHNANVAKWREVEKQRAADAEKAKAAN